MAVEVLTIKKSDEGAYSIALEKALNIGYEILHINFISGKTGYYDTWIAVLKKEVE